MNENKKVIELLDEEKLEQVAGGNPGAYMNGTVCNLTHGCLTIRSTPETRDDNIIGGLENGDWVIAYGRTGDFYYVYTSCAALGAPCNTPAYTGYGYVNANFVALSNPNS